MTNKSIPSYQFAPEDASGIAREWSGIASALPRKLFTLLFCLLFVGVGSAWGASVTFTSSSDYSSFSGGSLTKNEVTVSGFGSVQASDLRLFKGAKLTISATSNITALSFTFTNGSNNGGWNGTSNSYSVSGLSTTSWNKSATSGSSGKQARITQIVVTYLGKVTFNANGGSCATSNLTQATASSSITLPTPTRSGYICKGWYTASSGGTKRGNAGATYTPTVSETLYAQWEADAPAYTITAARNNASYGNVSLSGTTITATPAACCEYASPAYTVSPAGSATVSQDGNAFTVTPSANTTVTINFQEKSAGKTVNFDAGAGVCATASLTEDCDGAGVVLPSVTASGVCKGWTTFAGWRASAIATADSTTTNPGTLYAAGSTYYPSSNGETLYAVFSKTKSTGGSSGSVVVTHTSTNFPDGYGTANTFTEYTLEEYKFKIQQIYNNSKMQWRASGNSNGTGTIYNTETFPNHITSIVIVYTNDDSNKNISLKVGTSENPTSGTSITPSSSSNTYTFDCSGGTYDYFVLTNGSGAGYTSSVTINYGSTSTTYYCSDPNCCTALGSINGSVSWSSTGTSVTATVTTAGVSAYGDADNVSGYDFNLYTASAGGSAAATYSSDSKAGTSHEFTGLTPLTQYWVTVRPIGSGSYCNTTAESDRVAIYTCPGSPNHVDVSGRWDRFGGETISLTAAAYATAGTGTAIPAAKITGYQWQKYYNSIWNDISNGGTTSGATTNNLQITNCSNENSGSYRCVVSTVAGCDIASDGFQVKVYALECYNSGTTVYNFTRTGDTQAGTVQIDLSASTNYGYKVHADNDYYGNSGTVNEDVTNWEMSTGVSNNLTVASGLGGTFTFAIDYSTGGNNSTEGIPEISVTYPRKTIFLTPGVWNSESAKFAFYYFRKVGETIYGEGFTDFITADDCGSSAEIPLWNGVKINAVRLNSNTTASELTNSANHYKAAWDKKWNQTGDITITSNNSVSITGWGPDKGDSPYDYGTYAVPTYTISYATGSVPTGGGSISGSKANETKTCGVDFDLPAAQFTTTGYVQTGWAKTDGGAQYAAVSGSYTDNSAQTFYPVWTANTHTLTWDKNGGDALTGDYTSGTVAYATAITAPNTPTWTGHTFNGWHNGSSIVTPATTMPDNDLSYTAQWSLASYTVTLTTNGGTINAGNVTSYTYGTGATLPTNVTRDGYRFDGWFSDDGVWSDQVTAISTTATGDKTYYAKWTQVYTVTWHVNGSEWSSGVVSGNTQVPGGTKVSALPTAPTTSDCDDSKVFVGWKAAEIDGTSVSDPGGIFTTQAGSPTISANTTFYAVFADESGGDNTLVTNVSELTNGTQVYLYAEFVADETTYGAVAKAYDGSSNNVKATSGTVSTNKLTPGEDAGAYTIGVTTISAVKYYSFNDGTYYLRATGSGKNNYLVGAAELGDDEYGLFSIAISSNVCSIVSKGNTEKGVLQFNKNSDTGDYTKALFSCYGSEDANRSNVKLFKKNPLVYSNYVTTCASCDGDATFTNTTPAVSAIGCTGATLTATGGLATLGAAGCNVSDYGFVIGTSDNPAIGGSGVTKYQVGTSNPTIGDDFSYEATGLTKGTRYYIRAYAKNGNGTAYSTSTNFWTKDVSSIAITTAPTKTNYLVGETFDATGMVVTATMADSNTEEVTSDVTYSTDPLTSGTNQDFAINYTLCETDKSVNQKINVYTLSVSEGTNPTFGSYTVDGAVITVSLEAQKTFSFATTNCSTRDNGDGTYTVINVTGNATVVINYRNAVQVKVYYKVDGTTITSLTQDVYESSQTTLPTASALSSAMAAQGMALPDELYPNFIGWSETEFGAQTAAPTIVEGTPIINAEKNYYAVYSNVNKIRIDESDITSTSYPGSEQTLTKSSKDFKYHYVCKNSTYYLQFKKHGTQFGYIYNNTAISNIAKIEIGASGDNDFVPVYAGSAANTISGSALEDENTSTSKYIYLFPSNTQYFIIKGDNSYTYKVNYIDIYYASSTVYYMTQFCTRYAVTGASTGGTAVIVNGNTGGTLTSSHNELCEDKNLTLSATVNTQYSFGEWKIVKTGSDPEVDLTADLLGANKTSLTPPAFTMPGYGITVSATISEKTATAWSWTYNSTAIPDPMILYVGEVKQLDVTYTPDAAQLVADQKNYSVEKESSVAQVSKTANYYRMRGAAGVTVETNTAVTFSLNSLSQVVNVTVKPLPSARFEDNVHNAVSTTVTATVTDGVVSLTKKTPTHADVAAPVGGNDCETTHLHLVGWIDGDWEPFINYMNGGSRPSDSDITSATGYFYLPNADIDLSTKDGKTYYAVWGKVDE